MMRSLSIVFTVHLFFIASVSDAQIVVSPIHADFLSTGSRQTDIQVTNNDTTTTYVQVDTFIVDNPGTPQENRRLVKNPAELGLIVTPQKLAVLPNETQLVRVSMINDFDDKERVYRFTVKPVTNELVSKKHDSSVAAMVNVVVAYSLLFIVRPKVLQPDLTINFEGGVIKAKNNGNTAILLTEGKHCFDNAAGKNECVSLPGVRLYSGNTWEHKVAPVGRVVFHEIWPNHTEVITLEAGSNVAPEPTVKIIEAS